MIYYYKSVDVHGSLSAADSIPHLNLYYYKSVDVQRILVVYLPQTVVIPQLLRVRLLPLDQVAHLALHLLHVLVVFVRVLQLLRKTRVL